MFFGNVNAVKKRYWRLCARCQLVRVWRKGQQKWMRWMFKTLKWGYKAEKREGYLGSERIEWLSPHHTTGKAHTGKLPHKWVRFWKTANPTKLEKIREKKQAPLFIVFTTYRKHRRTDNTNHVRNKTEIPAGYPLVYYCFKHSTPSFISQLRERRQKILKKNTIKRRPSQKHTV